jgi:hypothetical protein
MGLLLGTGPAGLAGGAQEYSVYLDRSYYTTEPTALVVCRTDDLTLERTAGEIIAKGVNGRTLARHSEFRPDIRLAIPIRELPIGQHTITVSVLDRSGRPIASRVLNLVKRVPKPGCEWKIDQVNRIILRNGEPFFPHGILMSGSEDDFAQAAKIGFDTLHTWSSVRRPEHAAEYVDWAARYGLLVIIDATDFCHGLRSDVLKELVTADELESAQETLSYAGRSVKKFSYGLSHSSHPALNELSVEAKIRLANEYYEKNEPNLTAALNLAKSSPQLIGYCLYDEPASFLAQVLGRRLYHRVQEVDGYHPSFVVYSSTIPDGEENVDWMDCLGTDPYWTPGETGSRGNVNYVSKITHITGARAERRRQVTWSVPMAEYWSGIRKRAIMPKEQFCQTYLAIIHGAKAITYFRWPFKTQQTRDTHTALCRQMKLIGPIAVTPDIPQNIEYRPGAFRPDEDQFPDVQVSLRHNPAGGYVLLAANSRYYPVDVAYRVSLLQDDVKVKRLFDSKEYDVRDGTYKDHVEFLGTRAYVFDSTAEMSGPVEISVDMEAHPDRTDPVYSAPGLPDTGRPGRKNLLRNPGFEEACLPGWPDYYLSTASGPIQGPPGSEPGYGLENGNTFEGQASLWIRVRGEGAQRVYGACSPPLQEETPFVLSAYMRADRENVKVRFVGFGWKVPEPTFGRVEFTLSTEWQRFSERGTLFPGLPRWHSVGVEILPDQDATVFVDALQLEQGTGLTEYEP